MLRWISRSGTFIQFALFTVLLLVFWIPAFIHPVQPVISPSDGPVYSFLVSCLEHSAILSVSTALVLVVLQAFILFYVYQSNGFFGRSNFLPAILVLLAYSWNKDYQTLHAVLPAGVFMIISLNAIMVMYGRQAAYHQVFTAAFSMGIASLFYIPLAYLIILIWLTLITYRISSWREYVISVAGFILPLIYYLSWLFWNDNLLGGLRQVASSLVNFILPARLPMIYTIWLSVSAFIMFVTMVSVLNIMSDKLISLRRRAWVLFNFSFTIVIVMLLSGWPVLSANYLFVIPLSFFITGSLSMLKRTLWYEMLVLGYFLLFIGMKVYQELI